MLTRYALTCGCGHRGAIIVKENTRPYTTGEESYSLEEFDGKAIDVNDDVSLAMALEKLGATCPECGATQSSENLSD